MSSGVKVNDACVTAFNDCKLKHTKRYIIYKIENKKEIVIEKEGAKEETWVLVSEVIDFYEVFFIVVALLVVC